MNRVGRPMVRKKGRTSGPVVSLFAFQDIITATTGILVLFIMALALLIAEEAPPDVADLTETTTDVLDEQLGNVKQQVSALKSELERAEAFSNETTMTEAEFKSRLKYVATTKEAVKNEQSTIDAQVEKLTAAENELLEDGKEYERSLAEIEQAVEALSDRENLLRTSDFSARLKDQLAALKREIEKIKSNLNASHESDVKIIEYKFTEFKSNDVWVAHIRRGWCQLIDYGTANAATIYQGNEDEVVDWIADQVNRKNTTISGFYIYIAIAPSGVAIFNKLHLKIKNTDLDYGFDLLPNNQVRLK
jgi:hypothetical protein